MLLVRSQNGESICKNINRPVAITVITTTVTAQCMPESQLGLVFLLHGLSTLALVALASTHIYFAIRPEKLFYTRSMFKGWISEDEMKANHDPNLWSPKQAD